MNGITGILHHFNRRITQILINKNPANKIELPQKVSQLRANIAKRLSNFSIQTDIVLTEDEAQHIIKIYYSVIYMKDIPAIVQDEVDKLGIILETF